MADAVETLRTRFAEAGLPFPELPPIASQARLVSEWHLTTRIDGPPPYRVEDHVREFEAGPVDDYVVLAHDGHGVNSWAISYLVVRGPVGLFIQNVWGGAAGGSDEGEVRALRERFAAAAELLATSTDRLDDGARLAVVDSDLGHRGWAVLVPGEPAGWTTSDTPLADALGYLEG